MAADRRYRLRLVLAALVPYIAGACIGAGLTGTSAAAAPGTAVMVPVITRPALVTPAAAVPATLDAYAASPGDAALNWAEEHAAGIWYAWGGTGPWGYDCSGLVYESVGRAAGIWLPRTTYGMLGSGHLVPVPVAQAQRGDLMFFGSGHVEIKTAWWHGTFGAQQSGTRVGWHVWNGWWQPTMAFRIIG